MKRPAALAVALAAAVLYRVPYLLNPAALNSDGAVVGLQARAMLRGHWWWFLWGTNYQSSFDAAMHALAFALFGAKPMTMVCGTLLAALAMIALAFLTLRRHLGDALALACCAPLIFAPHAFNHFIQMGFRQWALTAFVAAVALLDSPRKAAVFLGCLLGFATVYLDVFTLQVAPALALLAAFRAREGRWLQVLLGSIGGAALLFAVRHGLPGEAPTQLRFDRLAHNLPLFAQCAAWVSGARAMIGSPPLPWEAPLPVAALQWLGALALAAAILVGGLAYARARIPAGVRQLGLAGFVAALSSSGGFLLSTWPADIFSDRYLAPAAVAIPFALAPLAWMLGARRFALAFAPSMLALLISGWLGCGDFVRGPLPVRTPRGAAVDERALRAQLLERGIHAAAADYWLAYRLSFLWQEDPVVANVEGWERMPDYRRAFDEEQRQALLFHPSVPQTPPGRFEQRLRARGVPYERREIAGFTALLFDNPRR